MAVSVTVFPARYALAGGSICTRPNPRASTVSETSPAASGANSAETPGAGLVMVNRSGWFVPLVELPQRTNA